jgi:hypothetical protein
MRKFYCLLVAFIWLAALMLAIVSCKAGNKTAKEEVITPPQEPAPAITPPQEATSAVSPLKGDKEWLNNINTYAYWGYPGWEARAKEIIKQTGVDVFIWGPTDKNIIAESHAAGVRYVPVLWGLSWRTMDDVTWIKDTYNVDLLQDYPGVSISGESATGEFAGLGNGVYICRTLFHQKLGSLLRNIIDDLFIPVDVDGVILDEISSYALNLNLNFDNTTMAAFNQYLQERYSADELNRNFGISNIDSFNYRGYLTSLDIKDIWQDPNEKLRNEFRKFLLLDAKGEIQGLIDYLKEKKPDTPITGNVYNLSSEQQVFAPLLDFLTFESPFLRRGSLGRYSGWIANEDFKFFGLYQLGEVIAPGKPMIVFPDIFDLRYLLDANDYSYYRLFLSEAFASGENFLLPFDALTEGGRRYSVDPSAISSYASFVKSHKPSVQGERWQDIGVLYDWEASFADGDFHLRFLKTTTALQEGQYLFAPVYCGSEEFINITTSLDIMKNYEAIVVPFSWVSLSETAQNLLTEYQEAGGRVLYLEESDSKENILSKVEALGVDKRINIENSKNTSVNIYDVGGNESTLLLVNYGYDWNQKDFVKEESLKISIKVRQPVKSVYATSPEEDTPQEIAFTVEDGFLKFTLPEVYVLSLVNVEYE